MKVFHYLFVFVIVFYAFENDALAQRVVVSESIHKYEIKGRSARKLGQEMTMKGPMPAFGGPKYFARAEPDYSWYLSFEIEDGVCSIEEYEVSVNVHYTVPYWADRDKAGKRLQKKWDKFIDALWVHEKGHGDIAVDEAVKMGERINDVLPSSTCDETGARVSEVVKSYLKLSKRQRAYDKETKHGETQGAYWEY